jgi:hypothetical protein
LEAAKEELERRMAMAHKRTKLMFLPNYGDPETGIDEKR